MPISKIFHDHIVLSNVDKHGVKQILYPKTTSDDVLMSGSNTTLTNFFTNANVNMTFDNNKGIFLTDSEDHQYPGIIQTTTDLWMGSTSETSYHHLGKTIISTGFQMDEYGDRVEDRDGTYWFPGNDTVYLAIPKKRYDADEDEWEEATDITSDIYPIIHSGNIGKNILLNDTHRNYYGMYNEKYVNSSEDYAESNLWVGASSENGYHHLGNTIISTGFMVKSDDSSELDYAYDSDYHDPKYLGNPTIYIAIPSREYRGHEYDDGYWIDDEIERYPVSVKKYAVLHEGNIIDEFSNYNVKSNDKYIGQIIHNVEPNNYRLDENMFLNRVPIKEIQSSTPSGCIDFYSGSYDDNPADLYGILTCSNLSGFTDGTANNVLFTILFNDYVRYDTIYFELTDISGNPTFGTLDVSLESPNPGDQVWRHSSISSGAGDGICKSEIMSFENNDINYAQPTDLYLRKITCRLPITASNFSEVQFKINIYCGNIVACDHFRSYNHMLSNILARLYKLENPST